MASARAESAWKQDVRCFVMFDPRIEFVDVFSASSLRVKPRVALSETREHVIKLDNPSKKIYSIVLSSKLGLLNLLASEDVLR